MAEVETHTSREQETCAKTCLECLKPPQEYSDEERLVRFNEDGQVVLLRDRHIAYLQKPFSPLPGYFIVLDASRTWITYWIAHGLDLLGAQPQGEHADRIVDFLGRCQSPEGGFAGGPKQIPHCAPTYSGVLALLVVGTPAAYDVINRNALYRFFLSMKDSSGGFHMHDEGEIDVRATYTVIAIAYLLNMLTPELTEGVADFVLSCQTYEGGFGGEPWNEAHGGYAFCGVAALVILGQLHRADVPALTDWLVARQMKDEGGFQGRTNKLVDGCYSFWQGGTYHLLPENPYAPVPAATPSIESFYKEEEEEEKETGSGSGTGSGTGSGDAAPTDTVLLNRSRLQQYILRCCQPLTGGLIDKPGKNRDFYHTCYCLSGLSIAQHDRKGNLVYVEGDPDNAVAATCAPFNIRHERVRAARAHFTALPGDHATLSS